MYGTICDFRKTKFPPCIEPILCRHYLSHFSVLKRLQTIQMWNRDDGDLDWQKRKKEDIHLLGKIATYP